MNHKPPLTLDTDFEDGAIVIDFLRHFDQFGKTKLHVAHCPHFGNPHSTAPVCECPLKQAWGSLDALIGRLRAAYEENGGSPESNPFGVRAVRLYLRDVKDAQAKSRGIQTKKKKRRPNASQVDNDRSIIIYSHGCSGSGSRVVDGDSASDDGVGCRQKSLPGTAQVDDGSSCGGVSNRLTSGSDNATRAAAGGDSFVTSNLHACTGLNIEQTPKFKFIAETPVEVNLRDKQCHGAWFPATILKEINDDLSMVGYNKRLSDEEWGSKAIVDIRHIRPSPPENFEGKNFDVSERVDAYYDCGWWSGKVTEVLDDNRYIVRFNHQIIEKEFNQFELRCHMEWINNQWITDSLDGNTNHRESDVRRTGQAQSLECSAPDSLNGSNTRKQTFELSYSNCSTKLSQTCVELRKGEVFDCSLSSLKPLEKEIPTSTTTNPSPAPDICHDSSLYQQTHPQNEKDTSTTASPSREFSDHLALDFSHENSLFVIAHPEEEISTSTTACPAKELSDHLAPASGHQSPFILTATPEKEMPTSISATPAEVFSDHATPNISQEEICGVLDFGRSESHPTNNEEFSMLFIPNVEREECDTSNALVQYSPKDLLDQLSPASIRRTDQQQCRRVRTGQRCQEMSSPGQQYCEKHLLERMVLNEKRRKKLRKQIRRFMDPFLPTNPQQCRRTGTGWRCHEMSVPGKRYCEKHQLIRESYNEKRRKRPREETRSLMDPFIPIGPQQCRRTGTRWRCHEMASPGKRYCEKHQVIRDALNEKRRKRPREHDRPREHEFLVASASDEGRNSDDNGVLPLDQQLSGGEDMSANSNECDD